MKKTAVSASPRQGVHAAAAVIIGLLSHCISQNAFAQTYCSAQGNSTNYEYISGVAFADIDNPSGPAGYSDFTSLSAQAAAGDVHTLTVTPGYSGYAYYEYFAAWIDFNQDGFFDPAEQVLSTRSNAAVSAEVVIPEDALPGATRMRVRLRYSSPSQEDDPCGNSYYGEVEDYTVLIDSSGGPGPNAGDLLVSYNRKLGPAAILDAPFTVSLGALNDIAYPFAPGAPPLQQHYPSDFAVLEDGSIAVLNGYAAGYSTEPSGTYLSFFDPELNAWEHSFLAGVYTYVDSNLARSGRYLFIASGDPAFNGFSGLMKFDAAERFSEAAADYPVPLRSVVAGDDGFIYAIEEVPFDSEQRIARFDTELNLLEVHSFPTGPLYDFYVDSEGMFYLVTNVYSGFGPARMYLTKYRPDGYAVGGVELPGTAADGQPLASVDFEVCGGIAYIGTNRRSVIRYDLSGLESGDLSLLSYDDNIEDDGPPAGEQPPSTEMQLDWVYLGCGGGESGEPGLAEACSTQGTYQNFEFIESVSFTPLFSGGLTVAHTSGSNGGYADFTETSDTLTIIDGDVLQLELTPGYTGASYYENWAVWIDFNNDGDFADPNEQVFTGQGNSTVADYVQLPTGLQPGVARMRVTMQYGGSPNSCGDFTYGEVEDYKVEIVLP